MPGFDAIRGQSFPIRLLQTFIRKASVPHALLFTGKQGIGKTTVARTFAAALNCLNAAGPDTSHDTGVDPLEGIPCGQCRNCRQIMGERHPDVILLEPQGAYLRIDQIRNLRASLSMKPFNAEKRVVIIADGQSMNPEAGNALLKLLEEPPEGTILIITALQPSDLLPTIVSRCRHIRFNPLCADDIRSLLIETQGLDPVQAGQLAQLCQGSLGRAMRFKSRPFREERDWLVRAAGLDQPGQISQRPLSATLAFAAQLAGRKERIQELLETLKTWIRDVSIYPFNPGQVINDDLGDLLKEAVRQCDLKQTLQWWQTVEKAQKDIAGNANLRLTLDVMAISLAGRTQNRA